MQFLVIGLDGTDEGAPERRTKVREQHIALGDELLKSGNMWYGAALLDDDGNMKGSALMMDFPSEKELQAWLDRELYVVGEVWKEITIHKCNTRDPWQFNRSKEWFEERQGLKIESARETAERYFALSNEANLDEIEKLLTDATTYSSPNVGVFLGREQIMEMKRLFFGSFKTLCWNVKEVQEEKPGVVVFDFTFSGEKHDGEKIKRSGQEYVIVKDGKLQHVEVRNK